MDSQGADPAPGSISSAAGRIPALDGLRGCAIVLVILFHANVWFGGEFGGSGGALSIVFGAGWIGVDLFFVLSGFLITRLLLEDRAREDRSGFFRHFYVRRALRIFPLYYGFLLLYLLLPHTDLFNNAHTHVPAIGTVSLALFFYNFQAALGHHTIPTLNAFWSLCIEEHFYLCWPLLVWVLPERRLAGVALLLAAIALTSRLILLRAGASFAPAYLLTPCRLDGLGLGAFIALAERQPALWSTLKRWAPGTAAGSAAAFLAIGARQGHFQGVIDFRFPHPPVRGDSRLILCLGITFAVIFFASVLVLAVEPGPRGGSGWRRLLAWPVLRALGKYSFAMYVFHRLLYHISSYGLVRLFPGYARVPPIWGKPLGGLWLIALSFAAAWVSYHAYEKHFLALKPRLAPRAALKEAAEG